MAYQSSYTGAEVDAAVASAQTAQQPPVEGAFVNGDKTKLDGIEALADVTDTANVAAAGALMDSEVTNLAAVKSFDPTDYATADQGGLADSAVQPGALATVATSGAYGDLSGQPTLGTAASTAATDYATAAQGGKADSAVQPADDASDLGSGAATDGYVLTADGVGGAAWEESSGGGATDYVRTRSGVTQDIFNLADTWNDDATTFTAIKMDVTDTASSASSLLLDLQVGGVSKFSVSKEGSAAFPTGSPQDCSINFGFASSGLYSFDGVGLTYSRVGSKMFHLNFNRASVGREGFFGFSSAASADGTVDLFLRRDAPNTFALQNGANAQAQNIYNTYTDASNYERARMGWAGNAFEIAPQAAGTGTVRVLHISGLPTSDPGSGILWNNAGNVEVGT